MGGLAERLHPMDLPAVFTGSDAGWWRGMLGALVLDVVGLLMKRTSVAQNRPTNPIIC
jgi:phosphate:Na+ symporter